MIFTDNTRAGIHRSIAEQRKFNADERRKIRQRAITAYRGEQLSDPEWIGAYINREETDIPFSFTRLTKSIVDKRSLTYKRPPERLYDSATLPGDYVKASARKDIRFKTLERYTNLLGVNGMMPVLKNGKFRYDIINEFEPIFLRDDPQNPFAIQFLVHRDTEPSATGFDEEWAVWSPDFHFLVDGNGGELRSSLQPESYPHNPFGILPVAFAHAEEIVDDFWTAGMGDVVHANQMIDIALTELNFVTRYQAFGQLYVTGTTLTGDAIKTGYNRLMTVEGQDTAVGVLNFNAPIKDIIETIRFQMELVSQNNNISMKWSVEGNPASGFSLLVQNIDLMEAREDDLDQWQMFEKDLYEIETVIADKSGLAKLPELKSVNFVEPSFPINAGEQRDKDEWDLGKGLVSIVELFKRGNPDSGLTDDKIKQMLIDNATLNKEVKPAQPVNALASVIGRLNTNNRRDE